MHYKKGEILELDISDLAFGGVGVGKISLSDGGVGGVGGEKKFVIFVNGAIPGDKVNVSPTRIKKQYAEARLVEVLVPSPARIKPKCKHFSECGGCSLQFMGYEDQIKWKEKIVGDALRQTGEFDSAFLEKISDPLIACSDPWFYRNKMEYSFGLSENGGDKRVVLGLHPPKRWREVFNLKECFLESQQSVEIMRAVREWAITKDLSAFDSRSQEGLLRNLVVREGKNTGGLMVNLIVNGDKFDLAGKFANWITGAFPKITSLYWTAVNIRRGHKTVIQENHLACEKTLTEELSVKCGDRELKLTFEILPQAFFQPNTIQAQILYGKILEFAEPDKHKIILDLFCGTGTIGMFCAKTGANVVGIDLNESAIENARENAKSNSITNIDFRCEDAGKALANLGVSSTKNALVITDPPRSGINDESLKTILRLRPKRWIYVSCNPTTLARDLKIICADGYKLKKVQPVDMFPHTYHVETVCRLDLPG